ncbi:MAG: aldehyde ferredoxin oxidoreductase family protein [Chloroflexota bacterium]|nr:MAG: aldehyde ferredoxin oxidoreductase family protein [Chloroflexota bacterium]
MEQRPEEALYRSVLGGTGLGVRFVFDRQGPGVDPMGPDSFMGFVTGPLTGSGTLFGTRYSVVARSPLTGAWGEANSGGDFGPYLKFGGYDAVFLSGVSDKPVYLFIEDGKAELRDAGHIWSRDCVETEVILQQELGKGTRVACIGPSGEKLSRISCVINDRGRAAARTGMGAVMGSKKIKAIAVRGKLKLPIADEANLRVLRKKYLESLGGRIYQSLSGFGTCAGTAGAVLSGDAPVKNWSGRGSIDFPTAASISDLAVIGLQQKKYGCWRCPVACGGLMKAGSSFDYDEGAHKPEYETLAAFGSMCLNDDVESIIKLNDICNRYGLDTISAGSTIAFAIECYENGIISGKDTDGIELTWGNSKAIVEMTGKLSRREGFGDILADGTKIAAQKIGRGAEKFAMQVEGQEVPMHDPRRTPGWGTSYKVDAAPGRHTSGNENNVMFIPEMTIPDFNFKEYSGRGEAHRAGASWFHITDSSGFCMLGYMCLPARALPEFLTAVTGWRLDMVSLMEVGERIANLRQAFTVREGLVPTSFDVPGRIIGDPPQKEGPLIDRTLDLPIMVSDYYRAMDWDLVTGKPSRKKLEALGLRDVIDAIGA